MKRTLLVFLGLLATGLTAAEPVVIPLWPAGAPGSESRRDEPERAQDYWVRNIHQPSLTVFVPSADKANGAAVVIIPGGGHRELVFQAEGVEAAQFFTNLGVTALVLKYRLAREEGSPYTIEQHARADAQRAMRLVRGRAAEWSLDRKRIGIMGFSAGGELVALVAYRSAAGDPNAADPIDRVSSRPDFQILIYPGPLGLPDVVAADAPPAFFLAANDDLGPARTITSYLERFRQAGVPAEVHLFARGQHAFNMGNRSDRRTLRDWPQRLADWMADSGLLQKSKP